MRRQAVARMLIRRLQARVALEGSLGAAFPAVTLPEPVDLTAPPPPAESAAAPSEEPSPPRGRPPAEGQAPAAPPPPGSTARRAATAGELGRAAGVELEPLTDLPAVVDKEGTLAPVREQALACTRCRLCEDRRYVVFGEGDLQTDLVFVGEAPGAEEDRTGRPFVGRAGELLTAMIEKGMQRPRSSVFICNILKCRPPRNRDPQPEEVAACTPYLHEQLRVIRPKLIIALGRVAAQILSGERLSMKRLRGQLFQYRGIPLLPIYHPAYLLRVRQRQGRGNPADRETWQDLQQAMTVLARDGA